MKNFLTQSSKMSINKCKIQQIINDIKEENYQLEWIKKEERDFSKQKKIKKLYKKIQKIIEESSKDKMLLLFELRKNLEDEYIKEGNKRYKVIA